MTINRSMIIAKLASIKESINSIIINGKEEKMLPTKRDVDALIRSLEGINENLKQLKK